MRPGQQAPESHPVAAPVDTIDDASMRPGQQAPESSSHSLGGTTRDKASMRPGQQAPESSPFTSTRARHISRFNEARAASPGILVPDVEFEP